MCLRVRFSLRGVCGRHFSPSHAAGRASAPTDCSRTQTGDTRHLARGRGSFQMSQKFRTTRFAVTIRLCLMQRAIDDAARPQSAQKCCRRAAAAHSNDARDTRAARRAASSLDPRPRVSGLLSRACRPWPRRSRRRDRGRALLARLGVSRRGDILGSRQPSPSRGVRDGVGVPAGRGRLRVRRDRARPRLRPRGHRRRGHPARPPRRRCHLHRVPPRRRGRRRPSRDGRRQLRPRRRRPPRGRRETPEPRRGRRRARGRLRRPRRLARRGPRVLRGVCPFASRRVRRRDGRRRVPRESRAQTPVRRRHAPGRRRGGHPRVLARVMPRGG